MPRISPPTANSENVPPRPLKRAKRADPMTFQKLIQKSIAYERNSKARALLRRGHYQDALNLLWVVLNDHPKDIEALTTKAKVLYRLGEDRKALEIAKRILNKDLDRVEVLYIKARLLLRLGKRSEALEAAKLILSRKPKHHGALYIKTVIDKKQKESEAALNILEELN